MRELVKASTPGWSHGRLYRAKSTQKLTSNSRVCTSHLDRKWLQAPQISCCTLLLFRGALWSTSNRRRSATFSTSRRSSTRRWTSASTRTRRSKCGRRPTASANSRKSTSTASARGAGMTSTRRTSARLSTSSCRSAKSVTVAVEEAVARLNLKRSRERWRGDCSIFSNPIVDRWGC